MAQIQRRKRVVGHHAGCAATTRQHEQDRTYQGSIYLSALKDVDRELGINDLSVSGVYP